MTKPVELPQGTLEMLILKAVSLGPLHGYGILLRIQQISGERLEILQGSFYTAIYRLEPHQCPHFGVLHRARLALRCPLRSCPRIAPLAQQS